MLTATSALALFFMLAIASMVYFVAERFKLPYTVLLALVGVLLVPISSIESLRFLREFQLTPELLFFIFLPTLLFESAYNINVRRVVDEIKPILLLAVFAYLLSAFLIGGSLWLVFGAIGLPIPFFVTFLFGAIISATDPVAVLALFKEYGAPRRLTLIFEGESLMNDATALALFMIVLGFVGAGTSIGTVALGGVTFVSMLIGGTVVGLFIGNLFIQLIGLFRKHEIVAITLMIVLAHSTFLITELANIWLRGGAFAFIQFSPIIATTVASLMMGNYGRFKITPNAEEFIEKFWSQFAFMANSLVFILVGFFLASVPSGADTLLIPTLVTIVVVAAMRAVSIYSMLIPFNLIRPPLKKIPMAWQHLLAWGSLRGALAVMLVLLVPKDISIPGWSLNLSVQEFLLVITMASIFATLFIKAPTIGPLMNRLNIGTFTDMEKIAALQARALIHGTILLKLSAFGDKKYIPDGIVEHLRAEHGARFREACEACHDRQTDSEKEIAERVLRLYAIGLEKEALKELFEFNEITERVFRRINGKLVIQSEEIERGNLNPNISRVRDKRDVFENIAEWLRKIVVRDKKGFQAHENYLYYRAQKILARKVIKELHRLDAEFESPVFSKESIERSTALYREYADRAAVRMGELQKSHTRSVRNMDEALALRSIYRVEEKYLNRLYRFSMLTPKLRVVLQDEYEQRAAARKLKL